MTQILLEKVTKRFGDTTAVDAVDLQIDDRELMVLVGPSGCGKSTLLRMIAGLDDVTEGTITIGDRVVNDVPPKDRDIAMVFQSYALYPHMTVRQNLEYGLKMRGVPAAERTRLIGDAARILGLGALLHRRPKDLSGGQRQRVAVGRAIVRNPRAFLFDEPLSNLDAKFRMQMRSEIVRLQRRLATTTVYVTHDQVEAMTMGHRIAVMNDGLLQQVGTPMEVYQRPANLFVATFLGSPPMNLLPVELEEGGRRLGGSGFSLPVPPSLRQRFRGQDGRRLVAGLRPDALREPVDAGEGATTLEAEVELAEPLGSEVVVHARRDTQPLVARLGPRRIPDLGSTLHLEVDLSQLHLFDAETEQRLSLPEEEMGPAA